jgi:glycosyltransferase involved in cell wall biosynthesis
MTKKLTVSLVYRNYKPLHSMYVSIVRTPPAGITVIAPKPKSGLGQNSLPFKMYRKFGRNRLIQTVVKHVDSWAFSRATDSSVHEADIYHYINMVPEKPPGKPFVVEFEHAGALFSFVFDRRREQTVKTGLKRNTCRAIICSSEAAKKTLKELFGDDYAAISGKVHVVYPAIDRDIKSLEVPAGLGKSRSLRLLFVGNDSYRKGMEETLLALKKLKKPIKDRVSLTVVSADAGPIIGKYPEIKDMVTLLPPNYSKQEIINDFYKKSDLLLLLTKQDTFGFAALDALSSGVPVLTTRQFALPEIVTGGKDGILLNLSRSVLDEGIYYSPELAKQVNSSNVDDKLVDEIVAVLTRLEKDRQKVAEMGAKALDKFKPAGRFSVDNHNAKLSEIYQTAVNGKID